MRLDGAPPTLGLPAPTAGRTAPIEQRPPRRLNAPGFTFLARQKLRESWRMWYCHGEVGARLALNSDRVQKNANKIFFDLQRVGIAHFHQIKIWKKFGDVAPSLIFFGTGARGGIS
jgi:hypothetical protein